MFNPPNPRYKGKPFLRFLELYVLWAIGELSLKESSFLEEITPKLRSTYHRKGEWQSIMAAEMDFPDHLPAELRAMWEHNCELARNNNVTLTAQQFAELVVDENFGAMNPIP
jgi:hypothetical protein